MEKDKNPIIWDLWQKECNLRDNLAREYGMPSNSLALANHKALEEINLIRKDLGLLPLRFDNFRLKDGE